MRRMLLGLVVGLVLGVGGTALAVNNYIQINTQQRLGAGVSSAIYQLAASRDALALFKADMDNMIQGTDYSVVETQFGIPTGKGQVFYNLVAGSVADMNASTNVTQLMYWTGTSR